MNIFATARYKLVGELTGHTDSVQSLTISKNGRIMASGGSDGVRLWNLATLTEIQGPPQNHVRLGQVTCALWLYRPNENDEILCYGTSLGYTVFWGKEPGDKGPDVFYEMCAQRCVEKEIMCMTTKSSGTDGTRLVVGTRDSVIQLWKIGSVVESIFSVKLPRTVPSAVAFAENGKDIILFGREDGIVYTLRGADGKVRSTRNIGTGIGHATLNNKNGQFVVDTGTGGFNLHETEDCAFVRNFATGTPIKRHPKQVKFGEKGQVVIGGSDHGIVYVFDRMTGNKLAELKAAEQGMVQTVTTHSREGIHTIVAATSNMRLPSTIKLWVHDATPPATAMTKNANGAFDKLVNMVLLFAAIIFVLAKFDYMKKAEPQFSSINVTSTI